MRTTDYTQAVIELSKEGMTPDAVLNGLHTVLSARGHMKLLPRILKELLVQAETASDEHTANIIVARSNDKEVFKAEITKALHSLDAKEGTYTVDPSITGGFIVETTSTRIDASYKRRLLTLYRSLIK